MATVYLREFPEDLHQMAKFRASQENVSLKELFARALEQYLAEERFPLTVEFEGKEYSATYTVTAGVLTVYSAYGWKATHSSPGADSSIAHLMVREMLEGAKSR